MDKNPAVVTPLDEHMGLDIARSLGRRGIPVYGIDPNPKAAGRASKYCELVVCPDHKIAEQDYIQFLVNWGKAQKKRTVLFPVSDETALICSRERRLLQPYFKFVMPDHATMVKIAAKGGLASVAEESGVPVPQTFVPTNAQEVEDLAGRLSYPVVLKPIESSYWHIPEIVRLLRKNSLSGRVKVVLCNSASELFRFYCSIATYDDRMVIQDVIQGPDENLSYISFYLNRQSKPLAMFAGRKLRVVPIGFGSASYVRSIQDPALEQIALKLLIGTRYQGLGGLEFKKDLQDGGYKLIEFNTRFGLWDGLGARCGVDTPFIAYQDSLGRRVDPQKSYRQSIIWIDFQRDIRAFWNYHQRGCLTLGQWLKSLRGEKMWAIYSWDDWKPGVIFSLDLLKLMWIRIARRATLK